MSERYEKFGSSVRLEASARGSSVITLREGGFGLTSDDGFTCGPLPPRKVPAAASPAAAHLLDAEIRKLAKKLAVVERVTVVEGHARHRLVHEEGMRRWEEANARAFVFLVRQPCGRRASVALGSDSFRTIDPAPVATICEAFAREEGPVPSGVEALTLEPWVTASLLRAMAEEGLEPAQGLILAQQPPAGARDGRGTRVPRRVVRRSAFPWPDCFRPSYRFAPVFTPLHVDLLGPEVADDVSDTRVVALASDWIRSSGVLVARVWITDPVARRVSLGEIAVVPGEMSPSSVLQSGAGAQWFPEGAGAWGRRLTLRQPAAAVRSS